MNHYDEDEHYELMADYDYRNEAFSDPDHYADAEYEAYATSEEGRDELERQRMEAETARLKDALTMDGRKLDDLEEIIF